MDARSVAFLGSRLFAILVLMMGIRQIPLVAQFIEMSRTSTSEDIISWFSPSSTYVATAVLFLTAYVMWVHAGWMSRLLTDSQEPEALTPSSWSALVYRGISLFVVFTSVPAAISAFLASKRDQPPPGASTEFIVFCGLIAMAVAIMIGSERLTGWASNVGPGPSEPDER